MSSPGAPIVAFRVHYTGHVQGVGFRATAAHFAKRFSVTGWVRNLHNGQVELLVEGPDAEVHCYLSMVRDYFEDQIHDQDTEPVPVTGKFEGFEVRR
jgi:acylphosphatase